MKSIIFIFALLWGMVPIVAAQDTQGVCPDSGAELELGDIATFADGVQTVSLLQAPDISAPVIVTITNPGPGIEVIDGPVCHDNAYTMWQVDFGDGQTQGWAVERRGAFDVLLVPAADEAAVPDRADDSADASPQGPLAIAFSSFKSLIETLQHDSPQR